MTCMRASTGTHIPSSTFFNPLEMIFVSRNNKRCGKGVFFYADGEVYDG